MTITALIIGDPHFKVSNVKDTDLMIDAIINVANEKNPDIIIILGDILDRHETIHVSPLVRAINFIHRLTIMKPVYLLIGNHDLKNNRQFLSDEHPFTALKYWDNLIVADKVIDTIIDDQRFIFVPYVPPGRFIEALNTVQNINLENNNIVSIFAHQEFKGAHMGSIISTDGDEWPTTYPHVISGHVHDYQQLQSNILYIGTPIQHTFGDNNEKTISLVTFHSQTHRTEVRIDLKLPRKQIIRITCDEVNNYLIPENRELKIIITGTSGEIKAIIKHPAIDNWKKIGHKICYKDIPLNSRNIANITDGKIISKAPLKFSTVLYNSINQYESLKRLYDKIFPQTVNNNIIKEKLVPLRLVISNNNIK